MTGITIDLQTQLYNDFTTKVLPKLAEGFTMTKDYAFELGGRYIKYLIIQDILFILLGFVPILVCIFSLRCLYKHRDDKDNDELEEILMPVIIISGILSTFGVISIVCSTGNLLKDIYIPEIRLYQELNLTK